MPPSPPCSQDGPTEAECARSIRQLTAGAVLSLDGIGAAPRMLGGVLAIGLTGRAGGVLAALPAGGDPAAGDRGGKGGARQPGRHHRVAAAGRGARPCGSADVSGTLSEPSGFSLPIQVVEAGGIATWLVEDQSVPVVSIAWSWMGGAALDPAGQAGAAALAAALLTEGAGPLRATDFADALRNEAMSLNFSADRDNFEGGFRTLRDALPEALRLARLAMVEPRLDADAVERVRARAVASARRVLETPRGQAGRAFWAAAFPGHSAGRPSTGTAGSIAALPVEAIRAALDRQLRREGLLVAVSGAITAGELQALLPRCLPGCRPGRRPPPRRCRISARSASRCCRSPRRNLSLSSARTGWPPPTRIGKPRR